MNIHHVPGHETTIFKVKAGAEQNYMELPAVLRVQRVRTKGCFLSVGARSNLKAIFDFHCFNVSKSYIVHRLNWP